MGNQDTLTLIPFGPFEADLHAQELRKLGVRLRLPRQSFQILKMLLEHTGELVTREELRAALWPSDTFVDFEHGLNAAINRLREALSDDADNPRYIETLPRRGYRFLAPLTPPEPALLQVTEAVKEEKKEEPLPNVSTQKWWALGVGFAGLCVLLAVSFYWFKSSTRQPRVLSYRQLTADRQPKGLTPCGWPSLMVADGPRVFFSEPGSSLMQVSSGGGDAIKLSTPFPCFLIFDISPDKTELLGTSMTNINARDEPLWVLSLATGLAHRVGNLTLTRELGRRTANASLTQWTAALRAGTNYIFRQTRAMRRED